VSTAPVARWQQQATLPTSSCLSRWVCEYSTGSGRPSSSPLVFSRFIGKNTKHDSDEAFVCEHDLLGFCSSRGVTKGVSCRPARDLDICEVLRCTVHLRGGSTTRPWRTIVHFLLLRQFLLGKKQGVHLRTWSCIWLQTSAVQMSAAPALAANLSTK